MRFAYCVGLIALTLVAACRRSTPPVEQQTDAAASATPSVPSGAPLARLVPKRHQGPRLACPLAIVPGVSFGPIALGETLDDIRRDGVMLEDVSDSHADVWLRKDAGVMAKLGVSLCAGKIIEVWIDDLRAALPCVTLDGKPVAPTIPRDELVKRIGDCKATEPRIGGAYEACADGGLYVGHGMGDFVQLRVRPKGYPFDDDCAYATDDGTLVELPPAERTFLLRRTLNLSELAPFWHPSSPGRDPLRIVRTPLIAEQPMTMFGSPVVWIDEKDAAQKTAYFTLTKLQATRTVATVAFTYPIEGVVGSATFKRRAPGDEWRLERGSVAER